MLDKSGGVEIPGGSDTWTGATGKGSIKRKCSAGTQGSYEYAFSIATP